MLLRKLPDELFLGRRTYAHDLFGAQEVEGYLDHLDVADRAPARRAGRSGHVRRVRARASARPPARARMLDGRCRGRAAAARLAHRRSRVPRRRRGVRAPGTHGGWRPRPRRSNTMPSRASSGWWPRDLPRGMQQPAIPPTGSSARSRGGGTTSARRSRSGRDGRRRAPARRDHDQPLRRARLDAVSRAARRRRAQARRRSGGGADRGFLDRCALEAVRIGQRSIMLRSVLKPCRSTTASRPIAIEPGVLLATMLPLTNTSALLGLGRFDPDRWVGRRLRDDDTLEAKEVVTTFGHGATVARPSASPSRRSGGRSSASSRPSFCDRVSMRCAPCRRRSAEWRGPPTPARSLVPAPASLLRETELCLTSSSSRLRGAVISPSWGVRSAPGQSRRSAPTRPSATSASPGNGMSSETVLFAVDRRDGETDRYAAAPRAAARAVSGVPAVRPRAPAARAWTSCAPHTDVPAPEVRLVRTRSEVARARRSS